MELTSLKAKQKRLKDEIQRNQEKLQHALERIEDKTQELSYKKELHNQELQNSEQQTPTKQEPQPKSTELEIEKTIKETLLEIFSERKVVENDPQELFFFEGQKFEVKADVSVHTVKVKYLEFPSDENTKIVPKEATFRITKEMKLTNLKKVACNYWKLKPDNFLLRKNDFGTLEAHESEYIDSFFVKNSIFPELWLASSDSKMSKYLSKPELYIDDPAVKQESQSNEKDETEYAKKNKEESMTILESYKGLKHYLPPRNQVSEEVEDRRFHGRDTSCCTFMFLVVLLILNLYVMFSRRDVKTEYWLHEAIKKPLTEPDRQGNRYQSIKSTGEMNRYVLEVLAPTFFISENNDYAGQIQERAKVVGPLIFRQFRTLEKECERSDLPLGSYLCYYNNYNQETKNTSSIPGGTEEWRYFLSTEESPFEGTYRGEFGYYDSSGYFWKVYSNATLESFRASYEAATAQGWIDLSVRGYFIAANLYEPTYGLWLYMLSAFEVSTNGLVHSPKLEVAVFKPNIFDRNTGAFTADIFRLVFGLYLALIFVLEVLQEKDGKRNLSHILSFQGIIDILALAMIYVSFFVSLNLNEDEKAILVSEEYTDLREVKNWYIFYHATNAFGFMLLCLRIIFFLGVNKRISNLVLTMQTAMKNMTAFCVILILILASFALILQSTWGTDIYMFSYFPYAFLSLLLFTLGHGDFEQMIQLNLELCAVFLFVYFFLMVYFLFATFMGIYSDAYKVVRICEGYNDDQLTWTPKKLLVWSLDWLPSQYKKLLFEKNKKREVRSVNLEEE